MTVIDVELMHAWMRADPPACCVALAKLGAEERAAALEQCDAQDLALLLRHAPVWWLNVVQTELPGLQWDEAISIAGIDINVIRMLRSARREVREHRLASLPERQRARVARALALPRDRVLATLDDSPPTAHLSETTGTVLDRIGSLGPSAGAWVYLVNDVEGYAGQVALVDLARTPESRQIAELPVTQRAVIYAGWLLADALRQSAWQIHDTLPVVDEGGRFTGVLRLCDLVRALRLTDADLQPPPLNIPMRIIYTWMHLLIALMGRSRSRR